MRSWRTWSACVPASADKGLHLNREPGDLGLAAIDGLLRQPDHHLGDLIGIAVALQRHGEVVDAGHHPLLPDRRCPAVAGADLLLWRRGGRWCGLWLRGTKVCFKRLALFSEPRCLSLTGGLALARLPALDQRLQRTGTAGGFLDRGHPDFIDLAGGLEVRGLQLLALLVD